MIGIQGKDAILSFYKNDWLPFVCSSDITIGITANKVAIRAPGDGPWKKYTYQDVEYTITLSGILQFDANNFTGWDMLNNQLGFMHVQFRCSFDDENGNVKSVQGFAMIETSNLSSSYGALVKNDFNLVGNGKIILFDGFEPCPTTINTITVTGQTASDGIAHFAYTFTGDLYQIKYKIDDIGDWIYVAGDTPFAVPGLPVGNHFIEIVPVCSNGYEGTSHIQDFSMTQSLTCGTVITAITINGAVTTATAVYTGAATQMKYRIDGGAWIYNLITTVVSLSGLAIGAHTIDMVPVCANNVEGTGASQGFTVVSQPAQSIVTYSFDDGYPAYANNFQIYVNGTLTISESRTISGSFYVPVGATVRAAVSVTPNDRTTPVTASVQVLDTTLSTELTFNQQTRIAGVALSYQYTTNGDNYTINLITGT